MSEPAPGRARSTRRVNAENAATPRPQAQQRGDGAERRPGAPPVLGARIVPRGRFDASRRVRKRAEYQLIQSRGRRVTTAHFVLLQYAPDQSPTAPSEPARLGITASRRIGKAHVRNRARRLCREAFRATPDLWRQGVDVVVIVRKPLERAGLADVVAEWRAVSRLLGKRATEALADQGLRRRAQPQSDQAPHSAAESEA